MFGRSAALPSKALPPPPPGRGARAEGGSQHGDALASGWLRTKGHDDGKLTSAIAGSRIQQLRPWNRWWTVFSRGARPGTFARRGYLDEGMATLKARRQTTAPRALHAPCSYAGPHPHFI